MEKLSLDFLNTLLLTPDNVAVVMKTGSLMMWEVTITYEEKSTTFEIHNKNVKPQMGAVYGEKGDLMKELSAFLPSCPSVFQTWNFARACEQCSRKIYIILRKDLWNLVI